MIKIAVAGTGYVGLSIATLLAQHNEVMAVDIVPEKVDLINNRRSPIQDEYIEKYLAEKELNLTATLDAEAAYKNAEYVVIAAPTNYDSQRNYFDTSAVENVIETVLLARNTTVTTSFSRRSSSANRKRSTTTSTRLVSSSERSSETHASPPQQSVLLPFSKKVLSSRT